MRMYSGACCARAGWIEYLAISGGADIHVSVAPDTDLDGIVSAYCHDEGEMIVINGWLFNWEEIKGESE